MIYRKLRKKQTRYICFGGITALFNLALMWLLFEHLDLNTPLQRNLANLFAIEISVIFSFFVYRLGVWVDLSWKLRHVLLRQIPLYHLSTATTISLRTLLIFPLFDWVGIQPMFNTLIGIIVGAIISYYLNDKITFSK